MATEHIVAEARRWLGTPYHHQASVKGVGCDCLGLVRGVWRAVMGAEPEAPPAYSFDWAEAARAETLRDACRRHLLPLDIAAFGAGDVLLFRMTRTAPAKHCAIATDNAHMIHAWTGFDKRIARFQDGQWISYLPGAGWHVWVEDEAALYFYSGSDWVPVSGITGDVRAVCAGRLTLASQTPVTTSDQTAKTVVYFTPCNGDQIALHDGVSAWTLVAFAEVAIKLTDTQNGTTASGSAVVTGLTNTTQLIAGMEVTGTGIPGSATIASIDGATQITLSANATMSGTAALTFKVAANKTLDIFGFSNAGALTLEMVAWSSATARATAITLQDGIYVKSGATTRRYLGTIRITGTTGQCEDSLSKRFVWNLYNRVIRRIRVVDNSVGWTYSTAAWRMANNNANNYVGVVIGVSLDPVYVKARTRCTSSTATYRPVFAGIGLDAVTHSGDFAKVPFAVNSSLSVPVEIEYTGFPGIGYHALNWGEYGAGTDTQTWDASGYDPGLSGWIVA